MLVVATAIGRCMRWRWVRGDGGGAEFGAPPPRPRIPTTAHPSYAAAPPPPLYAHSRFPSLSHHHLPFSETTITFKLIYVALKIAIKFTKQAFRPEIITFFF